MILVIAIMLLAGCKPKSKNSLTTKTDSTSNKGMNMPDIGDLKKDNNTTNTMTTSSNWSKTYRDKFLQGCITKASEKVSAAEAFSYCNCMTDKVEAKYPNENEVDAKLTSADIESMRVGCNSNTSSNDQNNNNSSNNSNSNNSNTYTSGAWSASDQKEFMDNCTPGASKTLGNSGAFSYCDCMLKKLMYEYPNSADVGNVSKSHMTELANDCLRK
jgi:hypothetical protein